MVQNRWERGKAAGGELAVAPWPVMSGALRTWPTDHGEANRGHRKKEEGRANSPRQFTVVRRERRWHDTRRGGWLDGGARVSWRRGLSEGGGCSRTE